MTPQRMAIPSDAITAEEAAHGAVGALKTASPDAPKPTVSHMLREATLADLLQYAFPGPTIKFHVTDPTTGKRNVKEIGV